MTDEQCDAIIETALKRASPTAGARDIVRETEAIVRKEYEDQIKWLKRNPRRV